jgi:NADPH:quinone reductase-like Zn-dependent oxidoreductase
MKILRTIVVLVFVACSFGWTAVDIAGAPHQGAKHAEAKAAWPPANAKDVESPDAILAATYDVISGPVGERDWNRFRSLFVPDGRLTAVTESAGGNFGCHAMTVEDYVRGAGDYFRKNAFYEREISRKAESFGQIMHVFSTYASRKTPDGEPFERGINSFQLFNDGKRWWVVSIYWDAERPGAPIPNRYLEK